MNKYHVLQAVFRHLDSSVRFQGINECKQCPACPLHNNDEEEPYNYTAQDICCICLEPYNDNMFYCDQHAQHRIHEVCLMGLLIHNERRGEYVPCPYKCGGRVTRLTAPCAFNVLMKSNLAVSARNYAREVAGREVGQEMREQLLRTEINYLQREIGLLQERRRGLIEQYLEQQAAPAADPPIPTSTKIILGLILFFYLLVAFCILFIH